MANGTIIKDEAALKAYLKEDNAREMTANDLLAELGRIYTEMRTYVDAYNTIIRKVELDEAAEKKLATYERNFEILSEDYARYAKWEHYASILEAVKDENSETPYARAIVEAVKRPYFRIIKVAARMDNKAGAKLAKESETHGLVSLTELQSFAQASIAPDGTWTRKASELNSLLTARVGVDIECGKEIGVTTQSSRTLDLYREARVDNKVVSNTKLTNALKDVVNAAIPEKDRKNAVHIAHIRWMIGAMTSSTKKIGELKVSKDGRFADLLISIFSQITGVTEGFSLLA